MGFGPVVLFDKSAFQALSNDDHAELGGVFNYNVAPILVYEVLADLAKAGEDRAAKVAGLAEKFGGTGDAVNVATAALMASELEGSAIPMSGQIVINHAQRVIDRNGNAGMLIDPHPLNWLVLRLSQGLAENEDKALATEWRANIAELDLVAFVAAMTNAGSPLPSVKTVEALASTVDELMSKPESQRAWLRWLLRTVNAPEPIRLAAFTRWRGSGQPLLRQFLPYSAHCLRALLALAVGVESKVLTQRPTNLLDIQYLMYLPFCSVFVSDDRLHRQIAPALLRSDQRMHGSNEIRAGVESHRAPTPGGLLHEIWRQYCRGEPPLSIAAKKRGEVRPLRF